MTGTWGVWCNVRGAVTGERKAWLKVNGEHVTFNSAAEAGAEAARQTRITSRFGGGGHYHYSAKRRA